jgi:hypothetical protein
MIENIHYILFLLFGCFVLFSNTLTARKFIFMPKTFQKRGLYYCTKQLTLGD